jgi:Nitronate monooxygenase
MYAPSVSGLGCVVPLMQAPLGRGAGARLATAVSQAGGLGTLGASWTGPAILREQIRSVSRAADAPFCVNLVLDFEQDERLEVAVEERVPWVSFSFGLRPDLVTHARAGGARVLVQVASADEARSAAAAGADALIVQGVEAGGHVQRVSPSPKASRATRSTSRSRVPAATSRRWRCTPARAWGRSTPWSRRQRSWSVSSLRCERPDAKLHPRGKSSGSIWRVGALPPLTALSVIVKRVYCPPPEVNFILRSKRVKPQLRLNVLRLPSQETPLAK